MRVGLLTQYYPPEIGAPQARLSHLATRLAQRGSEVHVLTALPSYPIGRIYQGYGGVFLRERLGAVHVSRTFAIPTKRASLVPRLANYLSFGLSSALAGGFVLPHLDYLITESPPLFLGVTGRILSQCKGARWIFNVSDLWPESAVRLGVVKGGWPLRCSLALEAYCYRKAWLVTGQSKGILASIHDRFPEVRLHHLSNGVESGRFRDQPVPVCLNGIVPHGACIAVYAGLHGLAQGLDCVLHAAAALKDVRNLWFVFAGDGPEREALIRMSGRLDLERVRFLGPIPPNDIPGLLSAANIVLITLGVDIPGAVPSKLYEAMAARRPLILAAGGEAAEIVRDTNSGIVVPPGDSAGIEKALLRLALNDRLRDELGANGWRAAEFQFDRTRIVDRFIDLLEMPEKIR